MLEIWSTSWNKVRQKVVPFTAKIFAVYFFFHFSIVVTSMLLFWHWENMLISYLATRKIVLPFKNVEELIRTSNFKIALNPGSGAEDSFKYSTNPFWQEAWKERIEPDLQDYKGYSANMIKFPKEDPSIALYDNFFSARLLDSL